MPGRRSGRPLSIWTATILNLVAISRTGTPKSNSQSPAIPLPDYPVQGDRWGLFLNDRLRLSRKLFLDMGGRLNLLRMRNSQWSFDPRGSLAYFVTRSDIVRFSAGSYHQYGDYFTLAGPRDLRPKNALHFSLSYDRITPEINLRVTVYDKEYRNLFLKTSKNQVKNSGRGFARGAELYLKLMKRSLISSQFIIISIPNERKMTSCFWPPPPMTSHILSPVSLRGNLLRAPWDLDSRTPQDFPTPL